METEKILKKALEMGFTTATSLDVNTLKVLPDVRKMCEVNTCGMYGKVWSCPPGCGELDECEQLIRLYKKGILVQTVGDIEDSLDWEGMMDVKKAHNKTYLAFLDWFREEYPECLPLADGTCVRCEKCTYPDSPCRFPGQSMASMEAFGLYVAGVCKDNNVAYNYGEGKMCYTGCFLYND